MEAIRTLEFAYWIYAQIQENMRESQAKVSNSWDDIPDMLIAMNCLYIFDAK